MLDAIGAGRWPERCDAGLAAHVARCDECSETAIVAAALLDARHAAVRGAPVPSSGLVWWRMQMRARREAAVRVERTLSFAHALVVASASGIALAILGAAWLTGAFELPPLPVSWTSIAGLAGAACVVLAPVAVWFAVTEE
jgi:hypothetical protein